ncbi:uncharacterized protein CBL_10199 [Carabus blaptoides fortunei]
MEDSVIETITDLNRICRTCLNEKNLDDLRSLFENTLDGMLNGLASVKITVDDGLPNSVCSNCAFQLKLAYSFMQQCQRSDSQLRTALGLPVDVFEKPDKEESDEKKQFEEIDDEIEEGEKSDDRRKIRSVRKVKVQELSDTDSEIADDPPLEVDVKCESKIESEQRDGTKLRYKYECSDCGKQFKFESSYKVHIIKHKQKRKCDVCDQEFQLMRQLNDHMKIHKDYRPHQCKECGKSFTVSASLAKHMRTHGGEKKHLCTICGKRFYEPNHLIHITECILVNDRIHVQYAVTDTHNLVSWQPIENHMEKIL